MKTSELTWAEIVATKASTIFVDRHEEGVRFVILRGPASLCAYLGVPDSHPLAGFSYELLNIDCHGGLTYAAAGKDDPLPKGWYWYGWDYAHCGDYCTYTDELPYMTPRDNEHKWTVEEVDKESWIPISRFKDAAKLAEQIAERTKQAIATAERGEG